MKINNKNYLLYLVIFAIILFIFYYIFSDKDALIQQLYHEFGKTTPVTNIKEGLTVGGLDWTVYNGYFADDLDFASKYSKRMSGAGAMNLNLSTLNTMTRDRLQENNGDHSFTIELKGYFLPNITGYWYFRTTSDDASYVWIGNPAKSGWSRSNATVNNGNLHSSRTRQSSPVYLTAGTYYPILIHMGENYGYYNLSVEWLPPNGTAWTSNGTGLLYPSNINIPSSNIMYSGLLWKIYQKYFNDDVSFPSSYSMQAYGVATNTSNLSSITGNQYVENTAFVDPDGYPDRGMTNASGSTNTHDFSMEMQGYFLATQTGTWSFFTSSDDASYVWIGDNATSGWAPWNAVVNNGGLHAMKTIQNTKYLEAGKYYPIRIQFGENQGIYAFRFGWKPPGGTWTCNGEGYLYNSPGGTLAESQNDHNYFVYK